MERLKPLQKSGSLPELDYLTTLVELGGKELRCDTVASVRCAGRELPLHCLELGSQDPAAPAIGFFGGVHGVERIGAQVVLAFLHALIRRLDWDQALREMLAHIRVVFMPLVNPGGMLQRTRSNPAGVDLMRNAPVNAEGSVARLLGGQRLSRRLPWYRGAGSAPMETESQALCQVVEERILRHRFALTVDCHSGFGTRDHLWFPYAYTRQPIESLAELWALRCLFRDTYPYHSIYVIEPQSRQYTTHGDLWDYLYLRNGAREAAPVFLPLTLELGSWLWIKKSPSQLFSLLGIFNPLTPHRHRRILRQHTTLLDFLLHASYSHERWLPAPEARPGLEARARRYWYEADTQDTAPPSQAH